MKVFRNITILALSSLILFGILYPLLIYGIGKIFPHQAYGLPIKKDGKIIGFENIGQPFDQPQYFWGRPSAVNYDASATGGSNKALTNPAYVKIIQQRIADFLQQNPTIKAQDIPIELVTASGGGLDPHISVQAAKIQIDRVAQVRKLDKQILEKLINDHTQGAWLGLFGPKNYINVLKLNLKLDEISHK